MNSLLIDGVLISPHCTAGRTGSVCKITIHHAVMINATAMEIANVFQTKKASATYCIGSDGHIVLSVYEKDTPWTSSSTWNDSQAITLEVANSAGEPDWKISDKAMQAIIDLCVDICTRYNFKLDYTGDKNGSLTTHKMYANTRCPGEYLLSKMEYICEEVNKRLNVRLNMDYSESNKYLNTLYEDSTITFLHCFEFWEDLIIILANSHKKKIKFADIPFTSEYTRIYLQGYRFFDEFVKKFDN